MACSVPFLQTAVPGTQLSFNPSRGNSLPCAGHNSVCPLYFGYRSPPELCVVWGDLPSQNLTFGLLVCDLEVTGTRVPELRCQPQFSQPESQELAGSPECHVSVLCCIPACDTGVPGELGSAGPCSAHLPWGLSLTVLSKDALPAQPTQHWLCAARGWELFSFSLSTALLVIFCLVPKCIYFSGSQSSAATSLTPV